MWKGKGKSKKCAESSGSEMHTQLRPNPSTAWKLREPLEAHSTAATKHEAEPWPPRLRGKLLALGPENQCAEANQLCACQGSWSCCDHCENTCGLIFRFGNGCWGQSKTSGSQSPQRFSGFERNVFICIVLPDPKNGDQKQYGFQFYLAWITYLVKIVPESALNHRLQHGHGLLESTNPNPNVFSTSM